MADKVRWGVLSTAKIGWEKVIPAMQKAGNLEIAAIASRDAARGQALATKLGIPKTYGSYDELLADPTIEAVYNPLPNHLHLPLTLKALAAGKHVLCEKPIGLNADEARQIAAAEAKSGRRVAEAFMVRHHPQWRRAREIARSGRLGEVRSVQTFFAFYLTDPDNIRNRADAGGGGLYDIGCYAIATARYIFDADPERVIGLFDIDPAMRTDRLTSGLAAFPGGRHLAFTCSTQLAPTQRVQVAGTKGRIEMLIPFNPKPTEPTRIVIDDGRDLVGGGAEVETFDPVDPYMLQGEAFSQAIRGAGTIDFPVADAVMNMRIIDAFFRSSESGRWEEP